MERDPQFVERAGASQDAGRPSDSPVPEISPPASAPKLAVVCDDFEPAACLIAEILGEEGFETLLASDGSQVMRILQSRIVDLLTIDLHMPGQEGIETINQIRQLKLPTKIVVVSGAPPEILAAARLLGASATFSKPICTPAFRRFVIGINDSAAAARVGTSDEELPCSRLAGSTTTPHSGLPSPVGHWRGKETR